MNLETFYRCARALAPAGRPLIVNCAYQSPVRGDEGHPPHVRYDAWVGRWDDSKTPGDRFEAATADEVLDAMAKHFAPPPATSLTPAPFPAPMILWADGKNGSEP